MKQWNKWGILLVLAIIVLIAVTPAMAQDFGRGGHGGHDGPGGHGGHGEPDPCEVEVVVFGHGHGGHGGGGHGGHGGHDDDQCEEPAPPPVVEQADESKGVADNINRAGFCYVEDYLAGKPYTLNGYAMGNVKVDEYGRTNFEAPWYNDSSVTGKPEDGGTPMLAVIGNSDAVYNVWTYPAEEPYDNHGNSYGLEVVCERVQ